MNKKDIIKIIVYNALSDLSVLILSTAIMMVLCKITHTKFVPVEVWLMMVLITILIPVVVQIIVSKIKKHQGRK